jgi:hypothetical protein
VHVDFHGAHDMTIQRFRPHATDPARCYVDVMDLKRFEGDYGKTRPGHAFVPLGGEQRGIVYAQDVERLTRIQRGLGSRGFRGAIYSGMERRIEHMHSAIDVYLGDALSEELRARPRR